MRKTVAFMKKKTLLLFVIPILISGCDQDDIHGTDVAPVANNQSVSTVMDTQVPIYLSGSDPNDDALTYSIESKPSHGSLSGTPPNLTYTPASDYIGNDYFTFTVSDGQYVSQRATVSVTVKGIEQGNTPVANEQSVSTHQNTEVSITLSGSDADGDTLSYSVLRTPLNGSLSGSAPNLIYTPASGYTGNDSFTFTVSDGQETSNEATVTISIITVVPDNTAPVANDLSVSTDQDTNISITLAGSDADGDDLEYALSSNPSNGSLNGTVPDLIYTPASGYTGSDSFTFTASDGQTTSDEATVSITIKQVVQNNNIPVANDQSVSTNQNAAVSILLTGSDVDGDTLTFSYEVPSNGTLTGTAPDLTYTPTSGYTGIDSFTFAVSDGKDESETATITITVGEDTQDNNVPVANDQSISIDQDTAVSITLTGSDVDGDALAYAIANSPSSGSISGTPPNLTYTPDNGYTGNDSFTFTVSDGQEISNVATVTISIKQVVSDNTKPVACNQRTSIFPNTDLSITLVGYDADGDALAYAIANSPSNGSLSGTAPNLTYTPENGYIGSDSFTFTVSNGQTISDEASVTVFINNHGDRPIAFSQVVVIEPGQNIPIRLTGQDKNGSDLTYVIANAPIFGSLQGTPPELTYVPLDATKPVHDTFSFRVSNGTAWSHTVGEVQIIAMP